MKASCAATVFVLLAAAQASLAALAPIYAYHRNELRKSARDSGYTIDTLQPCTGKWGSADGIYKVTDLTIPHTAPGAFSRRDNTLFLQFDSMITAVQLSKSADGKVAAKQLYKLEYEGLLYSYHKPLTGAFDEATGNLWQFDLFEDGSPCSDRNPAQLWYINSKNTSDFSCLGDLPAPSSILATYDQYGRKDISTYLNGAPIAVNPATRKLVLSLLNPKDAGFVGVQPYSLYVVDLDKPEADFYGNATPGRQGCYPQALAYDPASKRIAALCKEWDETAEDLSESLKYGFLNEETGEVEVVSRLPAKPVLREGLKGLAVVDEKNGLLHAVVMDLSKAYLVTLDVATGKPLCAAAEVKPVPEAIFIPTF